MIIFLERSAESSSNDWGIYLTFAGTIIVGILAALVAIRNAKTNRLVDTVLKARQKWIEDLRMHFVTFNKSIYNAKNEAVLTKKEGCLNDAQESFYAISLFLRPSEEEAKVLLNSLQDLIDDVKGDKNKQNFESKMESTSSLQRIILKGEWSRVKEEAKKGKLLNDEKVKLLYKDKHDKMIWSKFQRDND